MKPFLLFLYYGMFTSVVSVLLALIEIFRCWIIDTSDSNKQQCNLDENKGAPEGFFKVSSAITGIGLGFILFLGFLCLAVWCSQIQRIRENLTHVDNLQLKNRQAEA